MNSNENYRPYNFQALANVSGKFPEILNFLKFYNPTDKALAHYQSVNNQHLTILRLITD